MAIPDKNLSLYEFLQLFPDEEAARKYLESKIWPDGPVCPHCGSVAAVECKNHKPMPYRCRDCRMHFSVRTGTVLAESKIGLHKWLLAIYLLTTARKGIPSTQLARELGVTQKTAWFMAHRIREAWDHSHLDMPLGPDVEVDEAYFGGKEKNKHASKKKRLGRGMIGKQAVLAFTEREGRTRGMPIRVADKETLHSAVRANIAVGSTVYTDENSSYGGLADYTHLTVCHSVGEFVNRKAHTNGVESFWALLKRGYYGIYHHMSVKHLHRYVNEFADRRTLAGERTMTYLDHTVRCMVGRRLTWEALADGAKA